MDWDLTLNGGGGGSSSILSPSWPIQCDQLPLLPLPWLPTLIDGILYLCDKINPFFLSCFCPSCPSDEKCDWWVTYIKKQQGGSPRDKVSKSLHSFRATHLLSGAMPYQTSLGAWTQHIPKKKKKVHPSKHPSWALTLLTLSRWLLWALHHVKESRMVNINEEALKNNQRGRFFLCLQPAMDNAKPSDYKRMGNIKYQMEAIH